MKQVQIPLIRQYQVPDRQGLIECMRGLQEYLASIDPLHRHKAGEAFDAEAYVDRLLDKVTSDKGAIYVAQEKSTIVGCIAGIILQTTIDDELLAFPRKSGEILELFLDSTSRGKGTGKALMKIMEDYFKDQGCADSYVVCFSPNEIGHSFYSKCGYGDRTIRLMKTLSGE